MGTIITNKGFTLIELLIAILVSSVLMAGIYSVFNAQLKVSSIQEQTAAVQQNLRSAMYMMEREIRMAGYKGNTNVGAGFSVATATSMTFSYVQDTDNLDNNNDDTTDEAGEVTTIVYTLAGNNLTRTVDGQKYYPTDVIAENIDMVEFYYTLVDGSGSVTQAIDPDPALLNQIESVTISILARSTNAVPNTATGRLYTTPSGDTWGNTAATAGDPNTEDYNDGFYRRYITSSIICRNLTTN